MLRISNSDMEIIKAHARASFPNECCGILVGKSERALKIVSKAIPAGNINTDRAADRYLLDPKDQISAEREARKSGQEILGFYHSHPGHEAYPSDTDHAQSWPEYVYMILKVIGAETQDMNCFKRSEHFKFGPEHKPVLISEEMEII